MLENAGFIKVEALEENGYNSSPKTKGALVRGKKKS